MISKECLIIEGIWVFVGVTSKGWHFVKVTGFLDARFYVRLGGLYRPAHRINHFVRREEIGDNPKAF